MPAPDQREARLTKAIAHMKSGPSNRPTTEDKLRKSLGTHFRNKLRPIQLDELLQDFKKKGLIRVDGKKVGYVLK